MARSISALMRCTSKRSSASARLRAPKVRRQRRLEDQALHRVRERAGIADRHEKAVLARDHGLAAAGRVGGDDRTAGRHRLEHGPRHAFAIRGQDVGGARREMRPHIAGLRQVLDDALGTPRLEIAGRNRGRIAVHRSKQPELRLRIARAQLPRRLHVLVDALVAQQARDHQEGRRLERRRRAAVVGGVHPRAIDAEQPLAIGDDRAPPEFVEVVRILEEDAVGRAQARPIERARDLPGEPAGEFAAAGEGVAEAADHREHARHARQARRDGAVDHRFRGVREQQIRAQPA